MAQTRRRRQTKHRGDATGAVVARGRTGRKPTDEEKSASARRKAAERRQRGDRLDRPPTWRGAALRALFAAVLVLVAGLLLIHAKTAQSVEFFPVVFLIYLPLSYYTDLWLYRRRQARKVRQNHGAGS
ncbi:MAG: hypothetical protein KGJ43_07515 [Acidobacteriota bacterium]|nr:hypothetical protein [Acidobacteriota bacterium]